MTAVQRASVIELLRRAATLESYEENARVAFLHSRRSNSQHPRRSRNSHGGACCYACGDGTRSVQLAAAARVESERGGWSA